MKFASVTLSKAKGHILAHSVSLKKGVLKKGITLDRQNLENLKLSGYDYVTVAILEDGDFPENKAAGILANGFLSSGIKATPAFAGRVNLIAEYDGIFSLNPSVIDAFNTIDEAITLATLANFARVRKGALLATLKIIPYGVPIVKIDRALECIGQNCMQLQSFLSKTCDIILTRTDGFKPSLIVKAEKALKDRIAPLQLRVGSCRIVDHTEKAVAKALDTAKNDLVLILGASATSDRRDVIPAGIVLAGGRIEKFGMPVDPGNLLVLGNCQNKVVIGLPGCARAPALNGADWVLERICAGMPLNAADISRMGVGGLLKEIPDRIQPRMQPPMAKSKVTAVLLAAGSSSRMRGDDKLLRLVRGKTLLRHCVEVALASNIDHCIVVLKKGAGDHKKTLEGLPVNTVEVDDASMGMSASLRAGILAMDTKPKAILVGLADMPDLTADHFNRVIAAHNPDNNHFIICPVDPKGKRGHPVLFDAKFAESLANMQGDAGAKSIVSTVPEWVFEVPSDAAALLDLDTPEAWDAWEKVQIEG
jgi:molybdenum cofactor cytidylyltransferase